MSHKSTILLTGATGYIGGKLLEELIQRNYQVICLVRNKSSVPLISSLNITIEEIDDLILSTRINFVIHLATFFCADKFPEREQISKLLDSNIRFTSELANKLSLIKPDLILYSESASQYLDDSTFPNFYSMTKSFGSEIIEFFLPRETKLLRLVFPDTYGVQDPRPKLFSFLMKSLENQDRLELSEGNQVLNYLYIDDVIDGILFSIEKSFFENQISLFRLRNQETHTLREIVNKFEEVSNQKLEIVWGTRPYKASDVFMDSGFPEDLPHWKSKISLDEGIKKILNF